MKEIDDNLLTEFLEGKLDEPTNREIENWYDASEENRRRLETLYFVLFAGDRLRAAASVNTDQAFRSLQRRIELRRTKTRPQWRQIVSRYAAILVAGVIVAGMYLYQNRPDDRICTVSAEHSDCSVTLPDGSVIRLTRSSQLNYPVSFDDGNRTVHLTGEAFFEVSKRNGAPFTVTTVHDAEVVVRGTKFNLKAYDDSSDVETVLVEGAVDFRAAEHVVALHPGQKVSYNPTDNDLTLQTVNVEAELAARLRARFGRRVLGPMAPPVDRIRGEYLVGLLLKVESGASSARAREILAEELKSFSRQAEYKSVTVVVNVDPQ